MTRTTGMVVYGAYAVRGPSNTAPARTFCPFLRPGTSGRGGAAAPRPLQRPGRFPQPRRTFAEGHSHAFLAVWLRPASRPSPWAKAVTGRPAAVALTNGNRRFPLELPLRLNAALTA